MDGGARIRVRASEVPFRIVFAAGKEKSEEVSIETTEGDIAADSGRWCGEGEDEDEGGDGVGDKGENGDGNWEEKEKIKDEDGAEDEA